MWARHSVICNRHKKHAGYRGHPCDQASLTSANHCGPKPRCRQGGLGGAIVFGGGCCRRRWPPHRGTPYTRERARRWRTISESGAIPSHSREDCRSGALDREGDGLAMSDLTPVSYTHLRAHETVLDLVCRLLLEKKKKKQ